MKPLAQNLQRYFSFRELAIVAAAIVVSISIGIGVFLNLKREVVINDNGRLITLKTMKTTVGEVLDQCRIKIDSYDYLSLPLDSELQKMKTNEIVIKRAVPIHVTVDGEEKTIMTYKPFIGEALSDASIKLGEKDKLLGCSFGDRVVSDLDMKVVRIQEEYYTEEENIPFNVETRPNTRMDKGSEKVVREGKAGIKEKIFKVVFEDGKEVLRRMMTEKIASVPINKLVEYGTILNFKTSRGETVRYSKVLSMRSTAYTASLADTGKKPGDPGYGITYSGMKAREGVVAVDPKVIPLGTRMYIEGVGKAPDYGFAIAGDIGSAVKGNRIDLYYENKQKVGRYGIKNVKVYILTD